MISENDFALTVYDRTGFIVFETTEFKNGESGAWDGTIGDITKGDVVLNMNTYYWICVFRDNFGTQYTKTGYVNLIK